MYFFYLMVLLGLEWYLYESGGVVDMQLGFS